jgi:hypothetical protein
LAGLAGLATKCSISVSRELDIVEEILLPSNLGTPDNNDI